MIKNTKFYDLKQQGFLLNNLLTAQLLLGSKWNILMTHFFLIGTMDIKCKIEK